MVPTSFNGTGIVTFLNNSRLTVNGNMVLTSNATGSAKIGNMPTTTFITGELTMERYLPYTMPGGSWYFMGSPMTGKNFTDYVDDFRVSGPSSSATGTNYGIQGGGIISLQNPTHGTIFKYDELVHNVRYDTAQQIGWVFPGNENVTPGVGYRIFVNHYSNPSRRVTNKGAFVSGDFNFPSITHTALSGCVPVDFPCDEVGLRGWNLLANPYPCDVDWDATGPAWTKPSQMNNAFYTWNAAAGGYRVYLGTTGIPGVNLGSTPVSTNLPPNVIPSQQAFFVKVTSPGTFTLTVRESAKTTINSGVFTRIASEDVNRVRIRLNKNGDDHQFDAMVRMLEGATDGYDHGVDVELLAGSNYMVSVMLDGGQNLLLNTIAPIEQTRTIGLLTTYAGNFGDFTLQFLELESLLEQHSIFLKDNLLGTITPVTAGFVYAYTASATDAIIHHRFELVLTSNTITSTNALGADFAISVFPNPVEKNKGITLALTGLNADKADLTVVDAMGRTYLKQQMSLEQKGATHLEINAALPSGIYYVKVSGGNKTAVHKLIVK
jgi:hypothetical protein